MTSVQAISSNLDEAAFEQVKHRRAVKGEEPAVLTHVYEDDVNIVIWNRELSEKLSQSVRNFLMANPGYQSVMTVAPEDAYESLLESFGNAECTDLAENVAELVDMFCCLFDLKRAGLRLTALDSAMCPKFHVDRVPGRLVTTFEGVATQWLPHESVTRSKLGTGSEGKADNVYGLYKHESDIRQLACGDVAILKGESWEGNENAGLVHRSPAVPENQSRLLLTLDFAD